MNDQLNMASDWDEVLEEIKKNKIRKFRKKFLKYAATCHKTWSSWKISILGVPKSSLKWKIEDDHCIVFLSDELIRKIPSKVAFSLTISEIQKTYRMKNLIVTLFVFISSTVFAQNFIDMDLQARTDGWGLIEVQNDGSETILLVGNSICNGYKSYAAEVLKGYRVLAWVSPFHLLEKGLYNDMRKVMKDEKIALVHFNNGLHGVEKGVIPEDKYESILQSFVDSVKLFSKGAKLIWAATTPITTARTEDGKAVTFNPEFNPTITGRNKKAKKVMRKNHIPVNDLYSVCAANLPMSEGDRFHWNKEMCQKLGLQVGKTILKELEK